MSESAPEPAVPAGTENAPAPESAPPWGDEKEFNAEKAWNLIEGLRADKEKLAKRPVLDDDAQRKLAEYERLEQASKTELERATEEVTRWQSEAEKWRTTSVGHRIEALAATDFADTSDAASALDPSKYLGTDGQIDEKAIQADLAELLARKPHWRRNTDPAGPRVPAPNPAQGTASGRPASDPASEFGALFASQLRSQ